MHIIMDKIYIRIVKHHFSQIWNRVIKGSLIDVAQYLDNEWTEFILIFVYTLFLTRSAFGFESIIFLQICKSTAPKIYGMVM